MTRDFEMSDNGRAFVLTATGDAGTIEYAGPDSTIQPPGEALLWLRPGHVRAGYSFVAVMPADVEPAGGRPW